MQMAKAAVTAAENDQLQKPQDAGATGDGKVTLGGGSVAGDAEEDARKAPVKVCLFALETSDIFRQSVQHTGHTLVAAEQL